MRVFLTTLMTLALLAPACTYNPPPEAELIAPATNKFVVGDPIIVQFSEPIEPESLLIRVWPGDKQFYDIENDFLPDIVPIVSDCTLASSPCGVDGGVELRLNVARDTASLLVEPGALGPLAQPLVLEVDGQLADASGHRKKVSFFFAFQVVREIWDPYADTSTGGGDTAGGDTVSNEPLGVYEGAYLFFATFPQPIPDFPQQFFADMRVDQLEGTFIGTFSDADPISGAPLNTKDPAELFLDYGEEGFLFSVRGRIVWQDGERVFEGEPFDFVQDIGSIHFELLGMVMRGIITEDADTGLSNWDGTLAVRDAFMRAGNGTETHYGQQQANFQVIQLRPEEIPEGMHGVCEDNPCATCEELGGRCDLLPDVTYPPANVCDEQ